MKKFFQMFFVLLINALAAKRDAQVRFVLAQLAIARKKIPGNRIILDPEDRAMLMRLGEEMNHEVKDTLRLVSFKTYQQWFRDKKNGKKPKKSGRPKITEYVIALIVRFAKENWSWGPQRIVGELKKLGKRVGRSTVQRVLTEEGLYPDPDRTAHRLKETPWQHFLKVHMNTIVACDFLAKTIWTPLGKKTAYMLMFIHLESRKVFVSPATYFPDNEWVCPQARNVRMWLEDNGVKQCFLIRTNDDKYSEAFDQIFTGTTPTPDVEVVPTPVRAPNANDYVSHCTRLAA